MENLTNTTSNEEFEQKFKSKVNFGNLLNKNEKKNTGKTVSGLLQSTTQTVVGPTDTKLEKKLEDLEQNIEQKVDRVESLLQSVIISQQNFQLNVKDKLLTHKEEQLSQKEATVETQPVVEGPKKENKNLIIAAAIVAIAILGSSLIGSKLAEVKVEAPKIIAPKKLEIKVQKPLPTKYVATKFVNMRMKASSKAQVIMIVPPNSVIELLEQKFGWNKISFTDHVKNSTLTGWVYGENLKLLK